MIKRIFKDSWEAFVSNLGLLVLQTILMEVLYLLFFKLTLIGGELLRCFFLAGMYNVFFKRNKAQFEDLHIAFKDRFIAKNVLLYEIILILGTVIGLIFFIIPGIYFFFATTFALPIIVRERKQVITSIKFSIKIFNKNFFICSVTFFFIIFINLIAIFPYGLISLFTLPFSVCLIGRLSLLNNEFS